MVAYAAVPSNDTDVDTDVERGRFADVARVVLARGQTIRFRAAGSSMLPNVRPNDVLICDPPTERNVRTGDIVLYEAARRLYAHRVSAIRQDASGSRVFTVRADASDAPDPPVGWHQILAKVVAVERAGRRVSVGTRWAHVRQWLLLHSSRTRRWVRRRRFVRQYLPPPSP